MTVWDLNRDQLIELKGRYLTDTNPNISQYELSQADDLLTDRFIMEYWDGAEFTNDDFFSTAGESENESFYLELGDCSGERWQIADDLRDIARAIEDGCYSGISNNGTNWALES